MNHVLHIDLKILKTSALEAKDKSGVLKIDTRAVPLKMIALVTYILVLCIS